MVDAVQFVSGRHSSLKASNLATDVVHTLASKVLHTLLFTAVKWLSPEFRPTKVFHLAGRILEGRASLPSVTLAQATTDIPAFEDHEEVAKRRARLATEIIVSFDAHTSDERAPTTSYDSLVFAKAIYLSDVAARPIRERRGIRLGVVHLINDTGILVISRSWGNATRVAPVV